MKYTVSDFETLNNVYEATVSSSSPIVKRTGDSILQGYLKTYVETIIHIGNGSVPKFLPLTIRYTGEIDDDIMSNKDCYPLLEALGLRNKAYQKSEIADCIIEDE